MFLPSDIGIKIDSVLTEFIYTSAAKLSATLTPNFALAATLAIIVMGVLMINGKVNTKPQDLFWWGIKMGLIIGIYHTTATYLPIFSGIFIDLPHQLSSQLNIGNSQTASSTMKSVDFFYDINTMIASALIFESGFTTSSGWGMKLIGLFYLVLSISITIYITFLVIVSKMAIAILLALLPLFIFLLLFEKTKGMTEAWLQQLFNYALISLLIGVMMMFISYLCNDTLLKFLSIYNNNQVMNTPVSEYLSLLVLIGIAGGLFKQIPAISQAIAGGIGLSTPNTGATASNIVQMISRGSGGLAMPGVNFRRPSGIKQS